MSAPSRSKIPNRSFVSGNAFSRKTPSKLKSQLLVGRGCPRFRGSKKRVARFVWGNSSPNNKQTKSKSHLLVGRGVSKPGTAIGVNLGVAVKGSTLWGLKKSSPLVKSYNRNRLFQEVRKCQKSVSRIHPENLWGWGLQGLRF